MATTETFTTSGTWVCPADVNFIHTVKMWGGGGGGGGGDVGNGGGGGGGGAFVLLGGFPVAPAASYDYQVGTGGLAGVADDGTNGTASIWDTAHLGGSEASGGGKGLRDGTRGAAGVAVAGSIAYSVPNVMYNGGSGGTAGVGGGGGGGTSAASTVNGEAGNDGGAVNGGAGATAGGSDAGAGGDGANAAGNGVAGTAPGGGGGGGGSGGDGAAGAAGKIIITYDTYTAPPDSGLRLMGVGL